VSKQTNSRARWETGNKKGEEEGKTGRIRDRTGESEGCALCSGWLAGWLAVTRRRVQQRWGSPEYRSWELVRSGRIPSIQVLYK
jgi:hypothetical protein